VIGLALYGYQIMRVFGVKSVKLTNSRGFCLELATAITVIIASRYGMRPACLLSRSLNSCLAVRPLSRYTLHLVNFCLAKCLSADLLCNWSNFCQATPPCSKCTVYLVESLTGYTSLRTCTHTRAMRSTLFIQQGCPDAEQKTARRTRSCKLFLC
jgi:Phosphate transporter family